MIKSSSSRLVKKVSIINTFSSNGGDAAILFAIIKQVREHFGLSVQIIIYDQQRNLALRYLPGWDFRSLFLSRVPDQGSKHRLRFLRFSLIIRFIIAAFALRFNCGLLAKLFLNKDEFSDLDDYANSSVIITTGGTYLVENYPLWPKLLGLEIARILRKPLIFYTQSLGPFKKPIHRYLLRKIFNYARLILLRDIRSYSHVEELNVKKDLLTVSSDIVFSFAKEEDLKKASKKLVPLKNKSLKIGFTVRDWPYFKNRESAHGMDLYLKSIAAMVSYLVEKHQAEIIFVSTCQGIPEYHEVDSNIALKIKTMLPSVISNFVEVNEKFNEYQDLMDIYGTCDLVISTRMHGAILALSSGTPVLPIAYEFKTIELFRRFGLAEWVLDIETIEPAMAVHLLERYLSELPLFRETLFKHVEESRQDAIKSGFLMREAVEK